MTTTALTLPERAAVALGAKDYELKLAALVASSVRIVAIKNADGYKEAHGARMTLKNTRVEIEKTGKAAREDAQAFSTAVIAEQKRLIALITPEEGRLQDLQDEWDAARAAVLREKLRAEQTRIDGHRAGIELIRFHIIEAYGSCAEKVQNLIDQLGEIDVGDGAFEEFSPAANKAKAETIAALREIHDAATYREAEAARLQAEREELARQRAEQEAREAAERARIAAEQKTEAERLAAERAAFEAEQRIAREKQAELDRQAEAVRREADARSFAERAEADRKASAARAEADAILQKSREVEAARLAAERAEAERIADEELVSAQYAELMKLARASDAIRAEIDDLLDAMSADDLSQVFIFAQGIVQREAA